MNKIEYAQAEEMIGAEALAKLITSFGLSRLTWDARFAPSIVTRSELEMFGISMPRFAVRVYLDTDAKFFVNARRFNTMRQYRPSFSKRTLPARSRRRLESLELDTDAPKDPATFLSEQPCTADCFLAKPGTLEDFDVIECDLATTYAEVPYRKDNYSGVAYMQHIQMAGGGLCAQAVCFMAAALLHRHAKAVHGLVEITHYATNEGFQKLELCISGLDIGGIVNYLAAVNLNAIWQRVLYAHQAPEPRDSFPLALRAYVQSGMPVILVVDCERMKSISRLDKKAVSDTQGLKPLTREEGISIYDENKIAPPRTDDQHPNRHAVLVVGVEKRASSHRFVFNDPLSGPFMTTSAKKLAWAACYHTGFEHLHSRTLLPVTPRSVRLPLGSWVSNADFNEDKTKYRTGLLQIADELQMNGGGDAVAPSLRVPIVKPDAEQFKYLRIIPAGRISDVLNDLFKPGSDYLRSIPTRRRELREAIERHESAILSRLPNGSHHWVWVQWTKDSIWIWDAEQQLPDIMPPLVELAISRLLPVVFSYKLDNYQVGSWEPLFIRDAVPSVSPVTDKKTRIERIRNLKPSLITSISISGIDEALANWPLASEGGPKKHVDLYTFMQPDADSMLKEFAAPEEAGFVSAMEQMARLAQNEHAIEAVAGELSGLFSKKGTELVALATFIPEITSRDSAVGDRAVRAYIFLVKLARQLQLLKHPVNTIELVAGSLVDGVWPARDKTEDSEQSGFGANICKPEAAIQRLIKRLHKIAVEIHNTQNTPGLTKDDWLQLALEMEPGPLYILGDIHRIQQFCHRLEKNSVLSSVVGLNIDVPHWGFLAGIGAEALREPKLFQRIVHAHISDHGRGHFSDGVLNSYHDSQDFLPWLKLLDDRAKADTKARSIPRFSRFVALELEAAKSKNLVEVSTDKLADFLTGDIIYDEALPPQPTAPRPLARRAPTAPPPPQQPQAQMRNASTKESGRARSRQ